MAVSSLFWLPTWLGWGQEDLEVKQASTVTLGCWDEIARRLPGLSDNTVKN
jgi:hypothetical protein